MTDREVRLLMCKIWAEIDNGRRWNWGEVPFKSRAQEWVWQRIGILPLNKIAPEVILAAAQTLKESD